MSVESAAAVSPWAALTPAEALQPPDAQAATSDVAEAPAAALATQASLAAAVAAAGGTESTPWGSSPADELAAAGQLRGLTEMAREWARGPHALRTADDAASASLHVDSGGAPADAAVSTQVHPDPVAPGATMLPGAVLALHPGVAAQLRPAVEEAAERAGSRWREADGHGEESTPQDDGEGEPESPPSSISQTEPSAEAPWSAALLAALRQAAHHPAARSALQVAAEAWERGRAVLLACPALEDGSPAAWLFVLRPARNARPMRLCGERFAARLRWARPGTEGRWWCVRVAKSYSLRRGGQLLTQEQDSAGRVSCELQLGPFPPLLPRWSEVLVRVDRVQRLWLALGTQWSLPLLVCDQALLGAKAGEAMAKARSA